MYKVLLVSIENWDSLAEMPALIKKGGATRVDILCAENAWLRSNMYHDEWYEIEKEKDTLKKQLIKFAEDDSYNRIYLLDDVVIRMMNDEITEEKHFKRLLPITKMENREMLSSKAGFSKTCEKHGINSPKFIIYKEGITADSIDKQVIYPVLLKQDFSWSGAGIQFCANKNELEIGLNNITIKKDLVIQEYITGEDIGVEALFCNGQLVTCNCSKVLEYFETKYSFTTRRIYYPNPKVEQLLTFLGAAFGLNGFASIAYIYKPDKDEYFLIEVDTRANNWMPYGKFTGHDFSDGIRRIIEAGENPVKPAVNTGDNKHVEVALFYRDLRRCWKKKDFIGLMRWVFNYKGYWKFVPTYDKLLFKRMLTEAKSDFTKNKQAA